MNEALQLLKKINSNKPIGSQRSLRIFDDISGSIILRNKVEALFNDLNELKFKLNQLL